MSGDSVGVARTAPLLYPLDSIDQAGEARAVSIVPSDKQVPRTRHSP